MLKKTFITAENFITHCLALYIFLIPSQPNFFLHANSSPSPFYLLHFQTHKEGRGFDGRPALPETSYENQILMGPNNWRELPDINRITDITLIITLGP